ncbi:MAG: DEAD/DEAH box helicase [Candidatus Omnitrophica bacterium]|nr:DEAD/DEAH box helicase [Candidatus Omnitrophota bacterium]
MARNEQAIYTAPIKALSNQKFRDFRERFGESKIGILTGDVAINPDAPIRIMTTEIYRNTLFEDPRRLANTSWIIFDEVHYLDDQERGTVWEEAIMFSPPHVKLLCLSATVPNVQELAEWIRSVHERPIEVIAESHRPVPLTHLFQCQGKILKNNESLKKEGYLGRESWSMTARERRRGIWLKAKPNRLDGLMRHLVNEGHLPCIYFTFGRRRTETLAWELYDFDFLRPEEKEEVRKLYAELAERYNLADEKSAAEIRPLLERGIAFHHAGMLPTLKEVIERLFTSRLIKLIFTTETFALGINMPARSVVFDELRKFYGTHFANLRTRDFYQMAGRAGRRGMDEKGFVYLRIHPNDIPYPEVMRILHGQPEPVKSQFNTGYATLLNLYQQFRQELIRVYPRSFHHFQSSRQGRQFGFDLIRRKLDLLEETGYLQKEGLTPKGSFAAWIYGYELMLSEMHESFFLDELGEIELAVVLSSLVYEPRKGEHHFPIRHAISGLVRACESTYHFIHRKESKFKVRPYTKAPHFQLAAAVDAWANGQSFEKTVETAKIDEGELVRHFRMVMQLLRQLRETPSSSEALKKTAAAAFSRLNRGVVDAEKQLRI